MLSPPSCFRLLPQLAPVSVFAESTGAEASKKAGGRRIPGWAPWRPLALAKNNRIIAAVRFFAPLRCAQNDKLCYVLIKSALTAIFGSKSVSLCK